MQEWLDKHSNATTTLNEIAFELGGLARAFNMTGNNVMYKTLIMLSRDIQQASKDARDSVTTSIKESIDRSAESSKNLLAASLGGIMIAKREGE